MFMIFIPVVRSDKLLLDQIILHAGSNVLLQVPLPNIHICIFICEEHLGATCHCLVLRSSSICSEAASWLQVYTLLHLLCPAQSYQLEVMQHNEDDSCSSDSYAPQ